MWFTRTRNFVRKSSLVAVPKSWFIFYYNFSLSSALSVRTLPDSLHNVVTRDRWGICISISSPSEFNRIVRQSFERRIWREPGNGKNRPPVEITNQPSRQYADTFAVIIGSDFPTEAALRALFPSIPIVIPLGSRWNFHRTPSPLLQIRVARIHMLAIDCQFCCSLFFSFCFTSARISFPSSSSLYLPLIFEKQPNRGSRSLRCEIDYLRNETS